MTREAAWDANTLAADLGLRVVAYDAVGSTMDAARDDPGPPPAVHVAERQTAGKGRRGRAWASPAGNLHATIAWPDPRAAWPPAVLAVVQLACAETVEAAGGPRTTVKWPNDGYVAGGKWAGAIAERAEGPEGGRLLLGLGANLTVVPVVVPADSPPVTALAEHWRPWPGRARVGRLLLSAALGVLRAGPDALADRLAGWPGRDALGLGEALWIDTPEGAREGRYAGIAPDGRLRLDVAGDEVRLAAGDALHVRAR